MRGFVAPTDFDWFRYLRAVEPPVDEVNFWKPGSEAKSFRVLDSGEPFFFKLKRPRSDGQFHFFRVCFRDRRSRLSALPFFGLKWRTPRSYCSRFPQPHR